MGRRDWHTKPIWMGCYWSKCYSSNIWGVCWINYVQMLPSVVGSLRVGGNLLVSSSPWLMLGVCRLECTRVLHEGLLVPILLYGSETIIQKKGVRRMDKVLNAWIREFFRVTKGVDEMSDESVLRRFSHVERMKNDRIECVGSRLVG